MEVTSQDIEILKEEAIQRRMAHVRGQIVKADPKELLEFGHIQEVNRGYFHPRGLALSVDTETGELAILDHRDDLEGVRFGEEVPIDPEKVQRVANDMAQRMPIRMSALGYWQQPPI